MLHQIRQTIRARDICRTQAEQMNLDRAMRAHRPSRGSGSARCQMNFSICPRHQAAQPKP
jgi:hypothetical protein